MEKTGSSKKKTVVKPRHVAIIMDGNGRWAARKCLPRIEGHRAGAEVLRNIVLEAPKMGIEYLTVFAFSTENWHRSPKEVNGLMALLQHHSNTESNELQNNGIQVKFIGDLSRLDQGVQEQLQKLSFETQLGKKLKLTIAINYGGRAELTSAVRHIAAQVKLGALSLKSITENSMNEFLMTSDIPDPDLIIRTSGEIRLSNFLLWQSAYSELEFIDTLWPDFTPETLQSILDRYPERSRRFGTNG